MAHEIDIRLGSMGIELPKPPKPVAAYLPYLVAANTVYISGQLPLDHLGKILTGKLGATSSIEEGQKGAKLCAVNILAQLRNACEGDWSRVGSAIKLGGFVNSSPDFTDQPSVINGASTFLVEVMGESGRHARSAVGVASLPFGAIVEVDAIFSLRN